KDSIPSLQSLEKPEDRKTLLKQDGGDDCMSCRLVGTSYNSIILHPSSQAIAYVHIQRICSLRTSGVNGVAFFSGSGAFFGLAAYNYISGTAQLEARRAAVLSSKSRFGMGSRRAGITMLSLGLAWMG